MDIHSILGIITIVLAFVGIGSWVWWIYEHKDKILYSVAPISWLLHVFVFYVSYFIMKPLTCDLAIAYNIWSTAIMLHALFLVVGYALITILDKRSRKS